MVPVFSYNQAIESENFRAQIYPRFSGKVVDAFLFFWGGGVGCADPLFPQHEGVVGFIYAFRFCLFSNMLTNRL